jgi:hypothetical protein
MMVRICSAGIWHGSKIDQQLSDSDSGCLARSAQYCTGTGRGTAAAVRVRVPTVLPTCTAAVATGTGGRNAEDRAAKEPSTQHAAAKQRARRLPSLLDCAALNEVVARYWLQPTHKPWPKMKRISKKESTSSTRLWTNTAQVSRICCS